MPPDFILALLAVVYFLYHGKRQDHMIFIESIKRRGVVKKNVGVQYVGFRHAFRGKIIELPA
jgi:hypothetical protein